MEFTKDELKLLEARMVHDNQRISRQAEKQPDNIIIQGFYSEAVRRRQRIIYKINSKLEELDANS